MSGIVCAKCNKYVSAKFDKCPFCKHPLGQGVRRIPRGVRMAAFTLLVVALAAFYFPKGQLSGDVFIVTQGGASVRLSLVEVSVIPAKSIAEQLETGMRAAPCPTESQLEDAILRAKDRTSALLSEHNRCRQGLLQDLIGPIASAKTNADGHFEIDIPRFSQVAIVATASRSLPFGGTEHYSWLVPVNMGWKFTGRVQLTNDNLLRENSVSELATKWRSML